VKLHKRLGFATVPVTEGIPPTEFQIFPFGPSEFRWEGKPAVSYVLTPENAADAVAIARSSNTNGELQIDYHHNSDVPKDNSPAPAAGWWNLEAREDGLWAVNVRWTPTADQMLRDKEFKYFSPSFYTDDGGFIRRVAKLALTNDPATVGQEPLIASATGVQGDPMREKLIKQLGLADDATDEQIEAALLDVQARAGQFEQAQSLLAEAGITATVGSDEAAGQAMAAAVNAQSAARLAELEAENAELRTGQTAANAEALVETALSEGKILASAKAYWLEQATKNPKAAKAHFASLKPGATLPTEAARGGQKHLASNGLTETERQVIAQTGTSPEAFLATKKKLEEVRNAGA
jgi:phage I-like protein